MSGWNLFYQFVWYIIWYAFISSPHIHHQITLLYLNSTVSQIKSLNIYYCSYVHPWSNWTMQCWIQHVSSSTYSSHCPPTLFLYSSVSKATALASKATGDGHWFVRWAVSSCLERKSLFFSTVLKATRVKVDLNLIWFRVSELEEQWLAYFVLVKKLLVVL